jgi:hypothetical protein
MELADMNSELESVLQQAQQLDSQEKSQLIKQLLFQSQSELKEKSDNPWLATAGSLVDDPFFDDYIAAIDQHRKELDERSMGEENSAA